MSFTSNFLEELEKKKKKKLEEGETKKSSGMLYSSRDIAPVGGTEDFVKSTQATAELISKDEFDAPTYKTAEESRTWFKSGAFEDGYQFGDITKTVTSSSKDVANNIAAGILGIGEKVVDAGAYVAGLFGNDKFKEKTKDFIAKDLYDEEKLAQELNLTGSVFDKILGISGLKKTEDPEENSVFGEKTDALAQSGGQLLGTMAMQTVGVPWFLTSGVTSFGSEAEGAFNEGASYTEAGLSSAISAGAEILTEKLFGGSGLGEKGLINLEPLTKGISSKVVKALADLGIDMMAEGSEEVVSSVASRLGSALYEEKGLDELLLSEEAFDEYLESFIGGMALGGVANVGKAGSSIKTGTDYRTGLTANEEAVFEKVYNDRIAEAEENGEKLSNKEKAKLHDEVMNDLEKGYIDTDTIESVLGGETYKAYKDTVESEDALKKELDELRQMKSGDMNDIQSDRLKELKDMNLSDTAKRDGLKAQLTEQVSGIAKDDRLGNSYAEKARRGAHFEADLSKYNEKQKAVVQKAIDSGILNNTNRTHEFVDMVAKISADKGVLFDFTNNTKLKESGFAVEGKTVNGFVTKDGISVNIDSAKSLNSVVGHEITHVLEGTELYAELQKSVFEYARTKNDFKDRYNSLKALYKDIEGADVDAELTADLVGDYLFTDSDFINSLSTTNRNVFQKIYDEIKYLYKVATAGSKEARELEKVKRAFDKAYKESGKVSNDTKYSLADSDGKTLTKEQSEYFKDSKMRDENGNLKVMYHGSQDAGFHVFDGKYSDDDISFFFVDRNDVAASYSGTSETYEAQTIRTAEDMNNFIESIGAEGYEVIEKDGKFTLLYEGDRVAASDTAKGIYEEFCWYEGVGEGDANYKVYLNLTNPLVVDAEGRNWDNISREFSQEVADRYNSLTEEEKANLTELAGWEDFGAFKDAIKDEKDFASAYKKLGGSNANLYDLFSIASDNFSAESIKEFAVKQMNTRDYAQKAKAEGYDGVIFNNIHDNGGYSNGSEGASTVAIAFSSEQIKSVANEKPTGDPDIRYSLSEYTAEEKKAHNDAVKEHFGKTYSWAETGYLLLDGTRLDLSGKHDGAPGGYRTVDHRDITEALGYDYGGGDYSGALIQFMSEGNIRIIPECNGINLSVKPTKAQEQVLSNYISKYRGEVMLDIDDLNGNTVVSVEYPYGTYYTTVLNDIRDWFENGKKPENAGNYSLTKDSEAPKKYGNYNVYGEDVRFEAPTREDVAKTESTTEALEDIMPEGFAPVTEEEANALASENLASLEDADAPEEIETEYYEAPDNSRVDNKTVNDVTNTLTEVLVLDKEGANAIGEVVQRYSTGEIQSEAELFDEIRAKFGENIAEYADEHTAEAKKALRGYKLFVSDTIKGDIPEYNNLRKKLFGRLFTRKRENGGIPVDTAYLELSERYPDYFPEDIINPTEQFLLMAELAQHDAKIYEKYTLDDEDIQQAVDVITSEVGKAKEMALMQNAEADRRALMDEIAPVIEKAPDKAYEAIRPPKSKEPRMKRVDSKAETKTEHHTAEVYDTEPEVAKKKSRAWSKFRANFLDKFSVFEDLSLKTHNRELMGKANHMLSSESRAQWMIGNGTDGVKSLNSIREEVESTGKTKQFYEYLYHKHNVDRMRLEDRYEDVENKPVFGYDVTADISENIAKEYESHNPEFKEYAEDVYTYMNHLRGQMVESGVISQETADLWAEMYPHYVPIRRLGDSGLNVSVPLDTRKTGINAPVKRAKGGSRDILPLFDTMAMRTEQTFKAIAKNNFGVELKNTLGTTIESEATSLDEVIDNIDKHEELLQEGKDGKNPTFTVFEDGNKVTFEITEDMYDALKPTSDGLRYTNKAANAVGKWHRGILTEYNPVFMASNAIKDVQDILINSKHAAQTYANLPKAIGELATQGKWYREYMENGGEQNTYFDGKTNTFKKEDEGIKKIIGMPLRAIKAANNFVERAPRLAEYIASRKAGESVEVSMLDAARVTTNFQAGGDVTKFLNRNGATFLNASVQGFNQQVRNVREAKANGLKGWVQLATKFAVAGLPAMLLNHLLWDDDEDYAELSDYVKDNYYVVAKYGDGQFVRIPKGRTLAVIQKAFEQVGNALTGNDEVDLESFLELAISNLAPNNPIEDNILAPIIQAANNETWYGEDLVPTRLQDLPAAEQYDESTDALSKWLGEKLNISPYKLNYVLNQYSGGVGDIFLPMMTPEAERGDNSLFGNMIAPLKDKFTTDSVTNNQNVTDFYTTMDELTTNAKSSMATDEDILKYKYFNTINSDLGELYAEKREIQNGDLSDEEKYAAVRDIQKEIDALARESLDTYSDVNIDGGYAYVGDQHFRVNKEGEWEKITDKQLEKQEEVTSGLGISPSEYWSDKDEYDFAYEYPEKYEFLNNNGVTYDDYENGSEEFKDAYTWAFKNPEKFTLSKAVASDVVEYRQYASEIYDIKADKDEDGKSISGSRKEKVLDYINGLDIDYGEKIILFKNEYNADDTYNYDIIDYLNGRDDISYEEMETILKELGFDVDSEGNISWD